MADNYWILVDVLSLIYNITWLVFLIYKHYGKATTTAGHIFEIHVLLVNTVAILFFQLMMYDALPKGNLTEALNTIASLTFLIAIAGSQIETAIFLKTYNVNTLMPDTAGWIILAMDVFCIEIGLFSQLVFPFSKENKKTMDYYCDLVLKTNPFIFPCSVMVLVIVVTVNGFAMFRSI